ncbi:hypothetical protein BGZ68_010122 [Mortierella alpina]|nr:hypothetical protein BGZ68_010122 [Mortierella alpina]
MTMTRDSISSFINHSPTAPFGQAQLAQPQPQPSRNSIAATHSDARRRLIRGLRNSHIASHPAPSTSTSTAPTAASHATSMAAAPTSSSRHTTAATASLSSAGSPAAAASNASPMPLTTPTFTPSTPIVTPSTATASATNSPRISSALANTAASTVATTSNAASSTAGTSTTSGAPAHPPLFGTIAPSFGNSSRYFGQGTATTSTAASTPTAGSFSFGQPSFGSTTASTPVAGGLFTRGVATTTPSASTFTPSGLFNITPSALTAANSSASGSLFGQSTATVTPSTATAWTTTTTPTSTGLFGSTESLFKLTNTLHNSGRMSVNLDMTWSTSMVSNAEKSFTAPFQIKTEKPEDICISCVVKAVEDTFLFQIQFPSLEVMERFDWVKSASVLGMHRRSPTATAVTRWADSLMMSPIEAKLLPAVHDNSLFAVSIGLHSSEPAKYTLPLFTALPTTFGSKKPPTYCETILGRMLDDHSSHDVFFEFENPLADLKQVIETEIKTDPSHKATSDGKKNTDLEPQEKSSDVPTENPPAETTDEGSPAKLPASIESNNNSSKGHADQTSTTCGRRSIGAHKIVLSQVEYFQTMFSSSFAEGGPGVKRILIKDVDILCFRLLIEFIYLGELRPWSIPRYLTEDQAQVQTPTWEDVYLLADRYSIIPLREMAGSRILAGLHASWAVPFLFRTAYLFEELRPRVIKFVVKNCVLMIVQKKVQQDYFDHPECSAIFGEIITELSSVRA